MQTSLIRIRAPLADVICATPTVRALKLADPKNAIDIVSTRPEVFSNNPYVRYVYDNTQHDTISLAGYDNLIELDPINYRHQNTHPVDAYANSVFGHSNLQKDVELFWDHDDDLTVSSYLRSLSLFGRRFLVLHMARGAPSRTFPEAWWYRVIKWLTKRGYVVVQIGNDYDLFFDRAVDVYRVDPGFTVQQLAFLIQKASCFLAPDSDFLHVAGATNTPIVAIFTSTDARLRMPYRNGQLGYFCEICRPTIECYGCLHREPWDSTFSRCERDDYMCVSQILAEDVVGAVTRICQRWREDASAGRGKIA